MAPCQPPQEALRSCNFPQHPRALLQNLCLQPLSALKQHFLSVSNSGFRLSLILAEIQPLCFATKQQFGFSPSLLLHRPAVALSAALQPVHSIVLGKGETASACKAPRGVFWCNIPANPIEQEKGQAKRQSTVKPNKYPAHAVSPSWWGSRLSQNRSTLAGCPRQHSRWLPGSLQASTLWAQRMRSAQLSTPTPPKTALLPTSGDRRDLLLCQRQRSCCPRITACSLQDSDG